MLELDLKDNNLGDIAGESSDVIDQPSGKVGLLRGFILSLNACTDFSGCLTSEEQVNSLTPVLMLTLKISEHMSKFKLEHKNGGFCLFTGNKA